jgi:hypothetical protein
VVQELIFEITIDDLLSNLGIDKSLSPIGNKNVLSLVNDFEDRIWRYGKFQSFIWDNIAESALSASERNSLVDRSHSSLVQAAKNLRLTDKAADDIGKGSELAEVVLYGIMRSHYKALSVVPKIFYKQNVNDNAKGSDSVHIVIEDDGKFSIWLGEAKFYSSIEDNRLDSIVDSVKNSLQTDKLKKENSIITNLSDIDVVVDSVELRKEIKAALDQNESIDKIKSKLHIPILLLHECEITKIESQLNDEYRNKIREYHLKRAEAYFRKQIAKCSEIHLYSEIHFHIILFPVPLKENIINKFLENVKHYKGQ